MHVGIERQRNANQSYRSVTLSWAGCRLRWLLPSVVVLGREDLSSSRLLTRSSACGPGRGCRLGDRRSWLLGSSADSLLRDIQCCVLLVLAGHLIAASLLSASSGLLGSGLGERWLGCWCGSGLACDGCRRLLGCWRFLGCRRFLGRGSLGRRASFDRSWLWSRSRRGKKLDEGFLSLGGWDAIDTSFEARSQTGALGIAHGLQLLNASLDCNRRVSDCFRCSEGRALTFELQVVDHGGFRLGGEREFGHCLRVNTGGGGDDLRREEA